MKKVPDIESLAKYNSLNYEVLKGDKMVFHPSG